MTTVLSQPDSIQHDKTLNVAKAITTQIHTTEEAIDTALGEAASLMETFIAGRRTARLSAMIAGDIHDSTLKAMAALHLAQQHMTDAHRRLNRVRKVIGLETAAIIPPYDKPPEEEDEKPRPTGRRAAS